MWVRKVRVSLGRLLRGWRERPAPRAEPILEPELEARFLEAPGSRLFEGVLAVCDDEAQEQLESCLDELLSNEVLRYRLGAVQGILQLKRRLQEYEERARRRESEDEGDGEREGTEGTENH